MKYAFAGCGDGQAHGVLGRGLGVVMGHEAGKIGEENVGLAIYLGDVGSDEGRCGDGHVLIRGERGQELLGHVL